MAERIATFEDFWPFYVREHSKRLNRRLHFIGTSLVIGCALAALATQRWWVFALMPLFGYGFAWVGHFFVQKNRPATFQYPLWSLGADFVMYAKMWTGAMDDELRKLKSAAA
jgi:hypothetical protein